MIDGNNAKYMLISSIAAITQIRTYGVYKMGSKVGLRGMYWGPTIIARSHLQPLGGLNLLLASSSYMCQESSPFFALSELFARING